MIELHLVGMLVGAERGQEGAVALDADAGVGEDDAAKVDGCRRPGEFESEDSGESVAKGIRVAQLRASVPLHEATERRNSSRCHLGPFRLGEGQLHPPDVGVAVDVRDLTHIGAARLEAAIRRRGGRRGLGLLLEGRLGKRHQLADGPGLDHRILPGDDHADHQGDHEQEKAAAGHQQDAEPALPAGGRQPFPRGTHRVCYDGVAGLTSPRPSRGQAV